MSNRIEGIEYLRAVMSVFVVAWHIRAATGIATYPSEEFVAHALTVYDFVNFHILLLAVPTFIYISNYIYAAKSPSRTSLKIRILRLSLLLTFWPVAWLLYKRGYRGLLEIIPHSFGALVLTILQAGETIYYFFVCLICTLLLTHVVAKRSRFFQLLGFAFSTLLLACLPQFSIAFGFHSLSEYWSPLNFAPYSFAAVLTAQNQEYVRSRTAIIVGMTLVLAVVFAKYEWNYSVGNIFFPGEGYAVPPYTRASSVFSVLAISVPAFQIKMKPNSVIKAMAKYSLALYCLHPFVIEPVTRLVSKVTHHDAASFCASLLLVMLLTYTLAFVLRAYLRDEVIMSPSPREHDEVQCRHVKPLGSIEAAVGRGIV